VWLKKEKGGTSIGPHHWPEDGSVAEVPDGLAADLLAIPDGGFSMADPPKPPAKAAARDAAKDAPEAPQAAPELKA
jgi:hypothetical protein